MIVIPLPDLVTVEDHIEALRTAVRGSERANVLRSVAARHLGGMRIRCLAHDDDFTFAELRGHVMSGYHAPDELVPAGPDEREAARSSSR